MRLSGGVPVHRPRWSPARPDPAGAGLPAVLRPADEGRNRPADVRGELRGRRGVRPGPRHRLRRVLHRGRWRVSGGRDRSGRGAGAVGAVGPCVAGARGPAVAEGAQRRAGDARGGHGALVRAAGRGRQRLAGGGGAPHAAVSDGPALDRPGGPNRVPSCRRFYIVAAPYNRNSSTASVVESWKRAVT
jgi:hypothetical protein